MEGSVKDPRDAILAGDLGAALELAQSAARAAPSDAKNRILLFQLYTVLGEWQRALRQLSVIGDLDSSADLMVRTYRELIACEAIRSEVFAGKRSPLGFGEPEAWFGMLIEALRLDGAADHAPAKTLRDRAFELADTAPGTIDGTSFDWVADGDERLGPCLEAMINGQYFWVQFSRFRSIAIGQPKDLRDLVWLPASFTFANEGNAVGFIPTRYPESASSDDPLIRLARKTGWRQMGEGSYAGIGQRMLATNLAEHPLMEIRELTIDPLCGDG